MVNNQAVEGSSSGVGIDYTYMDEQAWRKVPLNGLIEVVGYEGRSFLAWEPLYKITGDEYNPKKILLVCDEKDKAGFKQLLEDSGVDLLNVRTVFRRDNEEEYPLSLRSEEDAYSLRDTIATQPIGAVVLLYQEGKLQHLDKILAVPTKNRGVKKLPIFHVLESIEVNDEGQAIFKKKAFKKVDKAAEQGVKQTITIEWADTIKREITQWLIPEFLPLCEVTAFSGEMDTRKSTTVIDIAARGSTGGGVDKCWFNNAPFVGKPFSTIYAGTEDSFSTVQNRFIAAGGNPKALGKLPIEVKRELSTPDGVEVVSIPLSFDEHLSVLRAAIIEANKTALYPIGLLINDPLIAFFGNKNFNKAQDCQDILVGLKKLCEELTISIINLMHYNKTQGASAKEKTGGSQRLIEAHRQAWSFTLVDEADKESNTLIAPIKKNLLRVAQSYEITTVSTPVEWEDDGVKKRDEVGVVKFVRLSDQTADGQLQEKAAKDKSKQTEMRDAVLETLRNGAVAPGVVYNALRDCGSESTILRAVNKLIKSGRVRKEGTGPRDTRWMLAETPEQTEFEASK